MVARQKAQWEKTAKIGCPTRQARLERLEVIVRVVMRWMGGVICLAGCLSAAVPANCQEIRDGQGLLTAMHDRYKDSWYESVVFKEKAITLNPIEGNKTEIWDEALELPGKLRINRGAASDGNGFVFVDGTLTTFEKGKSTGTRPFVHMLLVLGFDVYRRDPKATIEIAKGQGFDLTKLHEEKWDGEEVYVVGAAKGDLKSKQFWIEEKRLLLVRLIEPDEKVSARIRDTRFRGYQQISTGWISTRVEFYVGGKNTFNEDYFDIKADAKLDPALFDPAKFNQTKISSDANQ